MSAISCDQTTSSFSAYFFSLFYLRTRRNKAAKKLRLHFCGKGRPFFLHFPPVSGSIPIAAELEWRLFCTHTHTHTAWRFAQQTQKKKELTWELRSVSSLFIIGVVLLIHPHRLVFFSLASELPFIHLFCTHSSLPISSNTLRNVYFSVAVMLFFCVYSLFLRFHPILLHWSHFYCFSTQPEIYLLIRDFVIFQICERLQVSSCHHASLEWSRMSYLHRSRQRSSSTAHSIVWMCGSCWGIAWIICGLSAL